MPERFPTSKSQWPLFDLAARAVCWTRVKSTATKQR